MAFPTTIYDFIKKEESGYSFEVPIIEGWNWSMKEHIRTSIFYKNGRLLTGNTPDKPIKNIVLPILNLQYRAEDIDVKDINIYFEDDNKHYLSFLLKKYHDDVFVVENNIDDFIDEEKEEHIDLGGVLLMNNGSSVPDIIHLQDIAFCNQNDILSSPFAVKWLYSPDQLKDMESKGWGSKSNGATHTIDDVIQLVYDERGDLPGKDIAVYLVYGTMSEVYMKEEYNFEDTRKFSKQLHFVCFYKNEKGDRDGITLFKKQTDKKIFKLYKRDKIHNRALGRGGVEELFEDQVWTNYNQIQKKELLDAASKVIIKTTDDGLAARHPNGLKNLKNLDIIGIEQGKDVAQMDTYPRNIALFDKWDEEIEIHARTTGAAQEAISGDQPLSNTPFRSVEFQAMESHSLHKYRIGKHSKFVEELYRDWFIPDMVKQITKGKKFLSNLDLEDMQEVAKKILAKRVNSKIIETILSGKFLSKEEIKQFKELERKRFMENKQKFIEILKDEFKDVKINVKVNVSGKQKNMQLWTDKLVNIFRQIISSVNPQTGESILSIPSFAKIFNQIIEAAGLSPIDYAEFTSTPSVQALPQQMQQPVEAVLQPNLQTNEQQV